MIKVEVTHLKAPWPAGAAVGSVVLLAVASLPAWAAGKCTLVPEGDEREPVGLWEAPVLADPELLIVNPAAEADRKATESAAMLEALEQQLQDAEQVLSTARAEIQSLGAQLAEATARADVAVRAQLAAELDSAALSDALAKAEQALQAAQQAQRDAVPAIVGTITGDGAGEALPPVEEVKASPAKASKKGAA